jgi:hypothetical protein
VTVVLLVAFALLGVSAATGRQGHDQGDGGAAGLPASAGAALAVICLLATGLIVSYGLYLIVA